MRPKIAVIARVGAHRPFAERGVEEVTTLVPETPFGASVPVHVFDSDSGPFAVISRHGEEGYDVGALFVNDRANLWALKSIGVEKIISWSAPGSTDSAVEPGSLIIPHDILEWVGRGATEPATFFKGRGVGVTRAWPVFCPELRSAFLNGLEDRGFNALDGGVYAATTGPRLETAAEIEALSRLGASLVGMTICPEIWLARELELCYASICYSVNYAEGIKDRPFREGVLFEGLATEEETRQVAETEESFADIILSVVPAVADAPRDCPCPVLMERYRRRGDLEENWWLKL